MKKLLFLLFIIISLSCTKDQQCKYIVQVSHLDHSIDTLSFTAVTNNNKLSLSNGVFKVGNKLYIKDSIVEYKVLFKECYTVTDSINFIK
ncbi:hypothetical protein KO566_08365 [Flavobacteriaceae bacterium XHP0103]|uniref:hypothetical protein n=1 Tax=Marixanthotalea marina TaxID=2844359 RepID=UPI002989B727|nr:hypothetical protein [Marixanthotalea marina]MBU3822070.1 hypothetical protein [Marixanthotalea marina]